MTLSELLQPQFFLSRKQILQHKLFFSDFLFFYKKFCLDKTTLFVFTKKQFFHTLDRSDQCPHFTNRYCEQYGFYTSILNV